jgi:hypothetical protein
MTVKIEHIKFYDVLLDEVRIENNNNLIQYIIRLRAC